MNWVDKIVTVDEKAMEVTITSLLNGKQKTYKNYRCFHSTLDILYDLQGVLGHPLKGAEGYKPYYDVFTKHYGCPASHFKKVFNMVMKTLWVTPVEKYVQRYCFGKVMYKKSTGGFKDAHKVGINPIKLKTVWKRKALLDQSEEDGLKTIQPLLFHTGQSPEILKKVLGKGLWKRVCKQSYSRNLHISKRLVDEPHIKMVVKDLMEFPSKYLKRGANSPVPFDSTGLAYWKLEQKGQVPSLTKEKFAWGKSGNVTSRDIMYRISDTERMAGILGLKFNSDWTWNKIEAKHDEFTRTIEAQKHSSDKFFWTLESWVIRDSEHTVEEEEFTYKLLDNALDIRMEGKEMRHCVGSYSGACNMGQYMVYSVSRGGERYSTLGFSLDFRTGLIEYSQQYQFGNKRVDEPAQIAAGELLNLLGTSLKARDLRDD